MYVAPCILTCNVVFFHGHLSPKNVFLITHFSCNKLDIKNNNRGKKRLNTYVKEHHATCSVFIDSCYFCSLCFMSLVCNIFLYCFTSYRLIILKVTTWLKNIAKEQILHLKLLIYIINYKSYIFLYVDDVIQ